MPLDEIRKGGRGPGKACQDARPEPRQGFEQGTDTYISSLAGYLEALAN